MGSSLSSLFLENQITGSITSFTGQGTHRALCYVLESGELLASSLQTILQPERGSRPVLLVHGQAFPRERSGEVWFEERAFLSDLVTELHAQAKQAVLITNGVKSPELTFLAQSCQHHLIDLPVIGVHWKTGGTASFDPEHPIFLQLPASEDKASAMLCVAKALANGSTLSKKKFEEAHSVGLILALTPEQIPWTVVDCWFHTDIPVLILLATQQEQSRLRVSLTSGERALMLSGLRLLSLETQTSRQEGIQILTHLLLKEE